METKIRVVNKKVTTFINSLQSSLDKENPRLVKKYVAQLRDSLENLDESVVSAQVEGISTEEGYLIESNKLSDQANTLLIEADEFLLEVEENEEASALQKVNTVKLNSLISSLTIFNESLSVPVEKVLETVDVAKHKGAIDNLVMMRRNQLESYQKEKVSIESQTSEENMVIVDKLSKLYHATTVSLDHWVEYALKFCAKVVKDEPLQEHFKKTSLKGPSLKLDRLTLPVFKGNVRTFARFIREFESTVCLEFSDPKIQVMYLQNQCLIGPPKELVRNLTNYEEVMNRLKERYGNASLVVDMVLRDISDMKLNSDEPATIITLAKRFEAAWDDMVAVNSLDEFCNVITLRTLESKLPQRLQTLWAEVKNETNGKSSKEIMENLRIFVEKHRKVASEVLSMRGKGIENLGKIENKKRTDSITVSYAESSPRGCFRCGFTNHKVKDCKVPSTIKCRKCQKVGHIENACLSKRDSDYLKPTDENSTPVKSRNDHAVTCSVNSNVKSTIRLPIESVMTQFGPCTVLWDSGSAINLVNENWVKQMNIPGDACQLKFKVVDGTVKAIGTKCYKIGLLDRDSNIKIIRAYGLKDLATKASTLEQQTLTNISNQFSIDIADIDQSSGSINLLLGSGCVSIFPIIEQQLDDLCLMKSKYGLKEYLVAGNQEVSNGTHFGLVCNVEYIRVTPAHNLCKSFVAQVEEMKDFMTVEELGIRPPPICKICKSCEICKPASQFLSLKEYRELNVIKANLSYDEQAEVWTTTYPYKRDPSVLEDNYDTALKVLKRRENRLIKDQYLLENYSAQIKDFEQRGVIRKMTEKEIQLWTGPVRYVDHREVIKEGSTTPVRIVINSSFRSNNELSLNDILMKGPNVLTSLLQVLVKWRMFPVGFLGDISKMYHNVGTGEIEANLRRLLWRECEQNRPPDVYCFEKVTFGDRPAGCIVVSALQATAEMFSHYSKKAAHVLKQDSYMDDTLSGDNSIKEAKDLVSNIETIARKGGFKYKKFIFSGEYEDNGESKPSEKALGIVWEPSEDKIKVRIELNHNKKKRGVRSEAVRVEAIPFSRRICLRLVNGIFDPLGMATPVTVKLKMLMKSHFVANNKYKKWDTLLEPNEAIEWIRALQEILRLSDIAVPRHPVNAPYPNINEDGKFTLICFTDASQEAMCAAVYLRYETSTGEIDVGLIAAKTKVSPVKATTMPRLELCASLLGARLSSKIVADIEHENKCFDSKYFLMDSKIALGVLNKCHLSDEFNGNCAAEVRGKTEEFTFAWVDTKENIADLGTRGASVEQVEANTRWHKGPEWLREPIVNWPIEIYSLENIPVVDNIQFLDPIINVEKYSDIEKLHKLTALCLKYAHSRGTGRKKSNDWRKIQLLPEDYRKAEQYWIKEVSYNVIKLYNAGKLQSLRPIKVWDEKGQFLKVVTSGRLGELLKIGYDVEELTILDPRHPYTKLILKAYHEMDHGGNDRAVWRSRNRFWIPQARKIVKQIRAQCYRCKLLAKRNASQLMAPLPNQRVLPTPAWTYTSVDLFGPLEHVDMVRKRTKEKCWGIIFTCMVCRAVHIDLTQAYHTDALLQALRRFMALRGTPKRFLSDQGTQLVACSKEVAVMLELIDWSVIEGWCSRRIIEWHFIPPQGQHMNGVTESLIRSTKNILKQSLDGKRLTFIETQTVMHEVAQVLNSRPLGVYSKPGSDPLDGGPITPNHLLLGRASSNIPDHRYSNVNLTKRIRFQQTIVEEFWKKWKIAVFHSLVPQYKWHKTQKNVQIGDVVLVNDDGALVGEYKLGQVVDVKVSNDGLVRTAKILCVRRTDNNITKTVLERPIQKLCIIVPKDEQ